MIRFFRKLISKKERNEQYKLDEIRDGWYKYKNELDMPADRLQALQLAELGLDWNVGKEQLTTILTQVIDLLLAGKNQDAVLKLSALKEKVGLVLSKEMVIEICAIFFLHRDEPASSYSNEWTLKKREMIKKDGALCDFFLRYYLQKCKNLDSNLVTDSLNYFFQTANDSLRINKVLERQPK